MSSPTGEQFTISRTTGDRQSRAIITEVAAGLRVLEVDGVALVETYPEDSVPPYGSGIVLVPWPNRIEDGRWVLAGVPQQLDLTEPTRHNAIHGLLRQTAYRLLERSEESVTLEATVYPQHGYPFQLDTTVRYEVTDDGITVTHGIRNAGTAPAPVAVGAHPYLCVGDVPVSDLVLTLAASTHIDVDDRLNPTGVTDVAGTRFDLRGGVPVRELSLDDGFGGVEPGATHRLTAPDGRWVELVRDDEFDYTQVFTNPVHPRDGVLGLAIAVEPMSAAANAFNSGDGLRWLDPGEHWSISWGIRTGS
ncbi:MAG: aldose 1-epimerase family protein [Burkholderiaceae bacterium]|nr:aldose 1-epimerase family protein [Microbacteriaceae bacterium]